MEALNVIRRLHAHRDWANRRLIAACRGLTDEQLRQGFPIGQGSIWKSLLHLYAAEYVWLETLLGNDDPVAPGDVPGRLPGNQKGAGPMKSFDELERQWNELTARWSGYLAALTPESLDDIVFKKSTSSGFGKRLGTSRADVLLHLCLHAQYTTAQLVNMLRQSGIESLPDVMLISMARGF